MELFLFLCIMEPQGSFFMFWPFVKRSKYNALLSEIALLKTELAHEKRKQGKYDAAQRPDPARFNNG